MKELLNKFVRALLLYTAAIALVAFAISWFFEGLLTNMWPVLLLLFAGITLILVTVLLNAESKKFSKFVNTFMIASMLKIIILLVVIVGYTFKFGQDAIRFSVTLLVFYIFYMIFEIYWLMKFQRNTP
jgi:hypothetical protein